MNYQDYLQMLQEKIGAAVFSTIDENGQPQARYINVGVGNENGVFFMTSPKTDFFKQLEENPSIAITGMSNEDKQIQVIRLQGQVRKVDKKYLAEILKDNPYVNDVYPNEDDQKQVQAFQLYKGTGKYQHLQNKIVDFFEFDVE